MLAGADRRILALWSMQVPQIAGYLSKHLHFAWPGFPLSLNPWLWPNPNANQFTMRGVGPAGDAIPSLHS